MARIRTVKPEFFNDEKIGKLKRDIRLLYIGLWVFSDDYGTVRSNPNWIKSNVFAYDDELRVSDVKQWLDALVKARMLEPFDYNGEGFYNIRTFDAHQKVEKKSRPIVPVDAKKGILLGEYSPSAPRILPDYSVPELVHSTEELVSSTDGAPAAPAPVTVVKKKSKKEFVPPTQSEIQKFFIEVIGPRWGEAKAKMAADSCLDHYTANGWVQNKGKPIVDWKAAGRGWIRRDLNGDFKNHTPAPAEKKGVAPAGPAMPKPTEKPVSPAPLSKEQSDLKMKEFVNDLYCEFLADKLRVEYLATGAYDFVKTAGLMKMNQATTDQIMLQAKEKRRIELTGSKSADDVKLLGLYDTQPDCEEVKKDVGFVRMAKRLALLEFFGQCKVKSDPFIFNLQSNSYAQVE